jgi:hypothetical protein
MLHLGWLNDETFVRHESLWPRAAAIYRVVLLALGLIYLASCVLQNSKIAIRVKTCRRNKNRSKHRPLAGSHRRCRNVDRSSRGKCHPRG